GGLDPLYRLAGARLLMGAVGGGHRQVAAGVKLSTTIGVNDNSMADAAIAVAAPIVRRERYMDPLSPMDSIPYPGRLHAGQLSDTGGEGGKGGDVDDLLHGVLLRVGVHRQPFDGHTNRHPPPCQ